MYPDDCITIWAWSDAPLHLTRGMEHGGDEEMVIYVPKRLTEQFTWWFDISLRSKRDGRGWSNKLMHYRCKKVSDGWLVTTAHV